MMKKNQSCKGKTRVLGHNRKAWDGGHRRGSGHTVQRQVYEDQTTQGPKARGTKPA